MAFDRTRKKKIKTGTGPGTGIVLSRWCYKTGALFLLMIQHAFCDSISLSTPVRVIAELGMNESKRIKLSNGEVVELKLLQIDDMRDSVRHAVRAAYIRISIDGEEVTLNSGNYNLPVTVGKVQIDCPVVKGYYAGTSRDPWKLKKDARFRLWPKDTPYMEPETFVYPVKQAWFASRTQSWNEPAHVPRGANLANSDTYYHAALDIGGAEGMDEILSATDGLVISVNNELLQGYEDFPGKPREDVVYVVDKRGWHIRYAHLDSTDSAIKPGARVKIGQRIGFLGKQGESGGWAHLHFGMDIREPSTGEWYAEDVYSYLWEAYVRQYHPSVIAVARPHQPVWTGQKVTLDGGKSRGFGADIVSYEWIFSDGITAKGAVQSRVYEEAGEYSEILKVTDSDGNTDYDFSVVQVYDTEYPERPIPTIHAGFYPTLGIQPGDTVTFLVRTFNSDVSQETWDFGDGTPKASVKSETVDEENRNSGKYAEVRHVFSRKGQYIVKVERSDKHGIKAMTHLQVEVGQ